MVQATFEIGVVIGRRKPASARARLWASQTWASQTWASQWAPVAVLPAAPDLPAGARLVKNDEEEIVFAGAHGLTLHRAETGHYRDNLFSGRPALWVALCVNAEESEVAGVTADPYEGEAMAEGIGQIVEAVPMPDAIREAVAAFVAEHHVERPFIKRKRERESFRK
jgi:hypothetical protein